MYEKKDSTLSKTIFLDYSILILLSIFFFTLVVDYVFLNFNESPYYEVLKEISEPIFWLLISLFILDLYVKYKKYNNLKQFAKKHWFDIVALCLIPVFSGMKIAKLTIKLIKQLKILKTGLKFTHKFKKSLRPI